MFGSRAGDTHPRRDTGAGRRRARAGTGWVRGRERCQLGQAPPPARRWRARRRTRDRRGRPTPDRTGECRRVGESPPRYDARSRAEGRVEVGRRDVVDGVRPRPNGVVLRCAVVGGSLWIGRHQPARRVVGDQLRSWCSDSQTRGARARHRVRAPGGVRGRRQCRHGGDTPWADTRSTPGVDRHGRAVRRAGQRRDPQSRPSPAGTAPTRQCRPPGARDTPVARGPCSPAARRRWGGEFGTGDRRVQSCLRHRPPATTAVLPACAPGVTVGVVREPPRRWDGRPPRRLRVQDRAVVPTVHPTRARDGTRHTPGGRRTRSTGRCHLRGGAHTPAVRRRDGVQTRAGPPPRRRRPDRGVGLEVLRHGSEPTTRRCRPVATVRVRPPDRCRPHGTAHAGVPRRVLRVSRRCRQCRDRLARRRRRLLVCRLRDGGSGVPPDSVVCGVPGSEAVARGDDGDRSAQRPGPLGDPRHGQRLR